MPPEKTAQTELFNADIVILGAGAAGLAAAVAAAETGFRNVILLEKQAAPGGNTLFCEGPFAAESPVQKRHAIDAPRDYFVKEAMRWSHCKVNPRLVRAFVDKSGDTIRWLEEKGLKFYFKKLVVNETPLSWHIAEGYGPRMVSVLRQQCKDLGVSLLFKTQAKKILTGAAGKVTGVLAVIDGKELTITAGSVIIATGGFGGNKELLKKYCPEYHDGMANFGVPYNTGDGLLMAQEVGAATIGLGTLMIDGPRPKADRGYFHSMTTIKSSVRGSDQVVEIPFSFVALEPYAIWVNKKGRRFIDEVGQMQMETGFAVNRQPDHMCYSIFDSSIRQVISEQGINHRIGYGEDQYRALPLPELERELRSQADKGNLKIANSLDEMAEWMGIDPKALATTIDEYNSACDKGYDPIFGKDRRFLLPLRTAPYYGIECGTNYMDTVGGIKVNELMEVIDLQDNPIPGLYCAGVTAGGWEGDVYGFVLPGSASGFALNSGRIAAENAFTYVKVRN